MTARCPPTPSHDPRSTDDRPRPSRPHLPPGRKSEDHRAVDALVSIPPDGALVVGDDGKIKYAGERSGLPTEFASAEKHDHPAGT